MVMTLDGGIHLLSIWLAIVMPRLALIAKTWNIRNCSLHLPTIRGNMSNLDNWLEENQWQLCTTEVNDLREAVAADITEALNFHAGIAAQNTIIKNDSLNNKQSMPCPSLRRHRIIKWGKVTEYTICKEKL